MNLKAKDYFLLTLTLAAVIIVFQFSRAGQPSAFHNFADDRTMLGIHNCLNVVSNIPFLVIAIYGFYLLRNSWSSLAIHTIYSVLFLSVGLTAIGSSIYHWNPGNQTLIWDRGPLVIIFMTVTCAAVAAFISERLGFALLTPLTLIGIGSVIWWACTEADGHGDLRLYFLLQYYPMVLIPMILWLYYKPGNKPMLWCFAWVVFWYIIAKLLERWDRPIYHVLSVSGHTLKHLAAAVSTWYFVYMYRVKYVPKSGRVSLAKR